MKLPNKYLDLTQKLLEFDIWVTPSLGEISDSDKFKEELLKVVRIFDVLEEATNSFESQESCSPRNIAETFAHLISKLDEEERKELLTDLASTLFLVTGRSDNNFKCQFPLYLRDAIGLDSIPQVRGKKKIISRKPLPRVLKSEDFMKLIAKISSEEHEQVLLEQIVSFLLDGEKPSSQFWSIGKSYSLLKEFGKQESLLTPLVIFKVRGSVTASGGHEPEDKLRTLLVEWGLIADVDFNVTDIVVGNNGEDKNKKTRAFDFILPYKTSGWDCNWKNRLFIQCQYYAGDSGSVSHKVVDQTQSSRATIKAEIPDATFVEYLDGAGYFSSLNGDLRKMLALEDTNSYFQVRTSPVRLRRSLQELGFITPLELEHAILLTDGCIKSIVKYLAANGYTENEAKRSINNAVQNGSIDTNDDILSIKEGRRSIARKYAILDVAAIYGKEIKFDSKSNISGFFLVPGYGAFYGLGLDDLAAKSIEIFPTLEPELNNTKVFMRDVKSLCEEGFALSR